MNVYEQIESIFSGEADEKPQWAEEILDELREIKHILNEQKKQILHSSYPQNSYKFDSKYYDFIKKFRALMKPDTVNNNYPTFEYFGRKLGVDHSGLLYDKKDSKTLSKKEAFQVYRYAYEHQNKYGISA
jgi:hypothetical protein